MKRAEKIVVGAALVVLACIGYSYYQRNVGPWYLGCTNREGKDYLIEIPEKPEFRNGLVFIGKDAFTTPEGGMSCRRVQVKTIEAEKAAKGVDNPI